MASGTSARFLTFYLVIGLTILQQVSLEAASATSARQMTGEDDQAGLDPIATDNVYFIEPTVVLDGMNSAEFAPDGEAVFVDLFSAARIYDTRTGEIIRSWDTGFRMKELRLSPDGSVVASTYMFDEKYDGDLWDARSGSKRSSLTGHTNYVNDLTFSPDGTLLASAGSDGSIRIWDVQTGTELGALDAGSSVDSVDFSPDGKILASDGVDEIAIWDVRTGHKLEGLSQNGVTDLEFSSDGTRIAAAGIGEVKLWEMPAGNEVVSLPSSQYGSVAFSDDGSILATENGEVILLWEARTGQALTALVGHTSDVQTMTFSSDGRHFASIITNAVQLWGAPQREAEPLVDRSGVSVVSSGDSAEAFGALVPLDWLVPLGGLPRYEARIFELRTTVEVCRYNIGSLTRRRIDVNVMVIDLGLGEKVASREFLGDTPGECRSTETLNLYGGNYRDGSPPSTEGFVEWLEEVLAVAGAKLP